MNWTLPNILTILRLAAAPTVPLVILYFQQPLSYSIALIIFIIAGVTDFIDGYLARLWKQETAFGKMMDPIADKAMVIMALMVLLHPFKFDPLIVIPTLIIIFREILISGLREFLGENAILLSVTRLAKWKTSIQIIAICSIFLSLIAKFYNTPVQDQLINENLIDYSVDNINNIESISLLCSLSLLWIATALTFVSGYDYLQKALKFIKNEIKND